MFVLSKTPSAAGQYPPIMQSAQAAIPEGYYWWPDSLERETFYQYEGFVILTIKRDTVASYVPNEEAYAKWKEEQPEPEPGTDMSNYPTWDELAAKWQEGVNSVE